MSVPTNNIIRKSFSKDKYNCLTFSTHERYQTGFEDTNTFFYMLNYEGLKPWNEKFAPIPENHTFLEYGDIYQQLPHWLEFDFILSQNKFGNYQIAKQVQRLLHIPIIQLEHTLPPVDLWEPERIEECKRMRGDINVFISEYSMKEWGFEEEDVIHHCVDTDVFVDKQKDRDKKVLTVANDYKGRDYFLNFSQYQRVTEGLPTIAYGDTPGFSEPAKDLDELVNAYNTNQVFLNTAHISPIPTVMLEAAACGMAIVSCKTCAIPEYFTHEKDILFADTDEEMRYYLELLLKDDELAKKLGQNARKRMMEYASVDNFTTSWNQIFQRAANTPYLG